MTPINDASLVRTETPDQFNAAGLLASLARMPRDAKVPISAPDGYVSQSFARAFFGQSRAPQLLEDQYESEGNEPTLIDHVSFWRMCIESVIRFGDETHGIGTSPLQRSTWGMVFSAVNQMETVGEGMKRYAQLVPILPAGISVTLSHSARGVHMHYSMRNEAVPVARRDAYLESIAMFFHCVLRFMTGEKFSPIELRLSAAGTEEHGNLWSLIRCHKSRSGTGFSLVYDRDVAALPLGVQRYRCWCTQDLETFFSILKSFENESQRVSRSMSEALRQLLTTRLQPQDHAAEALKISTATLRRRLAAEGTSYRDIFREVRRERLVVLLASRANLDDIAVEVGLSDRRSLSRSCNNWLGMSPSRYRSQLETTIIGSQMSVANEHRR